MRLDSLLSLRWSQTNLETRRARVWGKGKWLDAQLPLRAIEILQSLPRGESDQVFTMAPNAVNMAWEGVREKADLAGLTFRDLRHVGATAYAKAGLGAHALMQLLGHTTTRMADVYVNLARSDVLQALDAVADKVTLMTPMPPTQHAHGMQRHPRQRQRKPVPMPVPMPVPPVPGDNVYHLEEAKGRLLARRVGGQSGSIDLGPRPARSDKRRQT
jgi:hypothetical protein